MLLSWVYTGICWIRRSKLSRAYGFLSVTYILHSLILKINGESVAFYLGFSLFWLLCHSVFRKIENISSQRDITKKEKTENE